MTHRPRARLFTRRRFLAGSALAAPTLAYGSSVLAMDPVPGVEMPMVEGFTYRVHRLIVGDANAREFAPSQISKTFPVNGSNAPTSLEMLGHSKTAFQSWALQVDGLCARPGLFTLEQLRAMPARTQITRHDCVEGWSAIAQWTGVRLSALLERVGASPEARFAVFHCGDDLIGTPYYESIDMVDAHHAQTILAYDMNGAPLPTGHGAPLRLRVERQLGYKHAKFVQRVELVSSLHGIHGGKGGFWEDFEGYEWYAGI